MVFTRRRMGVMVLVAASSGGAGCGADAPLQASEALCIGPECNPPTNAPISVVPFAHGYCGISAGGGMRCWGDNSVFSLVAGDTQPVPTVVPIATVVQAAANSAGSAFGGRICATLADHTLRCWGHVVTGLLNDDRTFVSVPTMVNGVLDVASVAVGDIFACALRTDATVRCWGRLNGRDLPRVPPTPISGMSGVTQLVMGDHHACGRLSDGTVRCWGENPNGELGNGTQGGRTNTPVAVVDLTDVTSLSASGSRTCARRNDGSVWCWGSGVRLVPNNSSSYSARPVLEDFGLTVRSVAVGPAQICALMLDNTVRCFGSGYAGDGTESASNQPPRSVFVLDNVRTLAVGDDSACARRSDWSVYCWGDNSFGQLGIGSYLTQLLPMHIWWWV